MKKQNKALIAILLLIVMCVVCSIACYFLAAPAALAGFFLWGSTVDKENFVTRCEYSEDGYTIKMVYKSEIYTPGKGKDTFEIIRESDAKTVYSSKPTEALASALVPLSKDELDDANPFRTTSDVIDPCVQDVNVKLNGSRVEIGGMFLSKDGGSTFTAMIPLQERDIAEQIAKLINIPEPNNPNAFASASIQKAEFNGDEQILTYDFLYTFSAGTNREVVVSRNINTKELKLISSKEYPGFF